MEGIVGGPTSHLQQHLRVVGTLAHDLVDLLVMVGWFVVVGPGGQLGHKAEVEERQVHSLQHETITTNTWGDNTAACVKDTSQHRDTHDVGVDLWQVEGDLILLDIL